MMKQEQTISQDACAKLNQRELSLLESVLASELECGTRYWRHHFLVSMLFGECVAELFIRHAEHKSTHARTLLNHIQTLGESQAELRAPMPGWETLISRPQALRQIHCDLRHERRALGQLRKQLAALDDCEPRTLSLIEDILAQDEDWNADISKLVEHLLPVSSNDELPRPNIFPPQIRLGSPNQPKTPAAATG